MNKAYRAICALGAAVTLSTAAVAGAIPAQAQTATWSVVFSTHYGVAIDFSGYTALVAPGPLDAWAFGANDLSGGDGTSPQQAEAVHWDGTAWQASALPAVVNSDIVAASVISPNDIWAVTEFEGYVLHWNGSSWSVATQLPGSTDDSGLLTGITALSDTDVWVFGTSGFTSGLGTWYYNGSTWTQQTGSATGITTASALSASDIWAIGSDGTAPQDEITHYDGTAWEPETSSTLTGLTFGQILAISDTDVWATAEVGGSSTAGVLVQFDGTTWSQVTLPSLLTTGATNLTADGQGGIWVTGTDSSGNAWAADMSSAGTWSTTEIGSTGTNIAALALVPGTTSLWGAGSVDTTTGSNATIWAYGTPPTAPSPDEVQASQQSGFCLDNTGDSSADGNPIQVWSCLGDASQGWTYVPSANGVAGDYQLENSNGSCLDDPADSAVNGTRVQLWSCLGDASQIWTQVAVGSYAEYQNANGLCLDNTGNALTDGNRVQVWACNGDVAQQWYGPSLQSGTLFYAVQASQASGFCLDNTGGLAADGNPIQIWSCSGNTNQGWKYVPSVNGVAGDYQLENSNGLCLDDPGDSAVNGTGVQLWSCLGDASQTWTQAGVNGYTEYVNANGLCLDNTGDALTDGNRVQVWACNGDTAQQWFGPGPQSGF